MKKLALAAAIAFASTSAYAGEVAPIVTDAETIVEPTPPAASGSSPLVWLIPIVAVVAIALAASD